MTHKMTLVFGVTTMIVIATMMVLVNNKYTYLYCNSLQLLTI